jgi:mannose-6-phosphate isomerase-like protein (cupin superfamily)
MGSDPKKVNLAGKFHLIEDYWSPKIVGELNGQYVKLAKIQGEFVWHHHENEDELFMVIEGKLTIQLRHRQILIEKGEFIIIPGGVEHRPVADEIVHLLLFESKTTLNTGNVRDEKTQDENEWL